MTADSNPSPARYRSNPGDSGVRVADARSRRVAGDGADCAAGRGGAGPRVRRRPDRRRTGNGESHRPAQPVAPADRGDNRAARRDEPISSNRCDAHGWRVGPEPAARDTTRCAGRGRDRPCAGRRKAGGGAGPHTEPGLRVVRHGHTGVGHGHGAWIARADAGARQQRDRRIRRSYRSWSWHLPSVRHCRATPRRFG